MPLWVKSNFSFLEGASHPDELMEQAHVLGLPAIALTDRDGVYGIVRAHMRALDLGVRVLIGAELTLTGVGTGAGIGASRVVALCQDREGYGHLCQLISRGRLRSKKGESSLRVEELIELGRGLIVLCPERELLEPLQGAFGDRLYASIARHLLAEGFGH